MLVVVLVHDVDLESSKNRSEEKLATFGAYNDDHLVFCREDGTSIPPHRVGLEYKQMARRSDYRSSGSTMPGTQRVDAAEAGVDIKVVSERLGHSSTRITPTSTSTSFVRCRPMPSIASRPWSTATRAELVPEWSTFGRFDRPQTASAQVNALMVSERFLFRVYWGEVGRADRPEGESLVRRASSGEA